MLCACGVKENDTNRSATDTPQKISTDTKDKQIQPTSDNNTDEEENTDNREVFTLDDKEYIVGVDVDKADVLKYQSGNMSKESLVSRILFKQHKNKINQAFALELPKHSFDPEYKNEVYSALEKCQESFFAPDAEHPSRRSMSFVRMSDYPKEYEMVANLGKEAVPYICSYIADYEEWDLYFLQFMDLSLLEMTGFKAEDYDLTDEELEIFNEYWKGKAYIILSKYNADWFKSGIMYLVQ